MALIVRGLAVTYDDGHAVEAHTHGWGQLVYAARGAIAVAAADLEWLIPPARAVWLPPGHEHRLQTRGAAALRTVYLAPELCVSLSTGSAGIEVVPLLRELILHVVARSPLDDDDAGHRRLADLLVDLIAQTAELPFLLRLPQDPRGLRAANLIRRVPEGDLPIVALADHAGVTVRTLQRLFVRQTGLRVSEWRQAARLQHAADLLLQGGSVTDAALACGYASVSAFVSAFRRRTGQTPLAYRRGRDTGLRHAAR